MRPQAQLIAQGTPLHRPTLRNPLHLTALSLPQESLPQPAMLLQLVSTSVCGGILLSSRPSPCKIAYLISKLTLTVNVQCNLIR